MTKVIEYRLRPKTVYVLTEYTNEDDSKNDVEPCLRTLGEFDSLYVAEKIAEGLTIKARQDNFNHPDFVVGYEGVAPPAPKVRTKFVCTEATPWTSSLYPAGGDVRLSAVWGGNAEDGGNAALENRFFAEATPSAYIHMQFSNWSAFSTFTRGDEYFVDLIRVPGDKASSSVR